MLVPEGKIVVDIRRRVNLDISDLKKDIQNYGLRFPIEVEGPDSLGLFYLIDGDRRLTAWMEARGDEEIPVNVGERSYKSLRT